MRYRCLPTCSRSSLYLYVSAITLFTICNVLAMMLISRTPSIATISPQQPLTDADTPPDLPAGGVLIGNLLSSVEFQLNSTRMDALRAYVIHDDVIVGNNIDVYPEASQVTLATQSSVDRLDQLFEMAETWRAPLSVAVFVPGIDFYIAKVYIAYLRLCSQVIRANASFHFLYHRDMSHLEDPHHDMQAVPPCSRRQEALPLLLRYRSGSFRRWWTQALHPQNHLRNVARRGCRTDYHFLTDIDILPVHGLAQHLDPFLRTISCHKCTYVVPTYEMPEKLRVPNTKAELLERVKEKQCRPFHSKVFIHNQYATNHTWWETLPGTKELEAAYKISNYEFFYEPFYVAKADVPQYDERFIGYGFTRNTQVFEMHLAGFELWVLNPIFAIHRGMQNKRGRGAWRERQNILNRKQFVRFKKEMEHKYRTSAKLS